MERAGEDCLVRNVEQLLQAIQRKYDTYGVTHEPFVIVKPMQALMAWAS